MRVFTLLLILASPSTALYAQSQVPRFHDERCGISFEHPSDVAVHLLERPLYNWEPKRKQPVCSVGITYPGWSEYRKQSIFDEPEYPVTLDFYDSALEEIADIAGFNHVGAIRKGLEDPDYHAGVADSQWITPSRGPDRPAKSFAFGSRVGIRGTGWSRIWATDRCNADQQSCIGSVSYELAVVCQNEKCAIVYSHVVDEFEDVIDCIVQSLSQ